MDPRLLRYYNDELQHLREMGGEFASQYPKIAGRLGLDAVECADPYVERLLEGFAFLAARVRLKVDAEFPRFTQHLLGIVYPHVLAPSPSAVVVQFQPNLGEGALAGGVVIPRGTALRGANGRGDQATCEYRTAHDVTLLPIEISDAEYLPSVASVAALGASGLGAIRAGLRLRLRTTAALGFDKIALDRLSVFLRGASAKAMRIYELLFAATEAVLMRPATRPAPWQTVLRDAPVRPVGFEPGEALLPATLESFDGYRLLQEYFLFPDRYMFFEIAGLAPASRWNGGEIDLVLLFRRADPELENAVGPEDFGLFCTPAVNLFPKRLDRVHLTTRTAEHHLVPDRGRPLDFEVHSVLKVTGFGAGNERAQEFLPFFAAMDLGAREGDRAYYTLRREPRLPSSRQRIRGPRSSYAGSEVFLSLVDADETPYRSDLRQVAVEALCTNRDLPLDMPVGKGETDFTLQLGAPVEAVRCVAGPSRPKPSSAERDTSWRLISHLALNYLSLVDGGPEDGAAALRELLSLYADGGDPSLRKQIEGVRSIASRPVVRRSPEPGPIAFRRGLELTLTYAEEGFEGMGGFLLGAVLERFFAKYVSINSFTEMVLRAQGRGEVMRWQNRAGWRRAL